MGPLLAYLPEDPYSYNVSFYLFAIEDKKKEQQNNISNNNSSPILRKQEHGQKKDNNSSPILRKQEHGQKKDKKIKHNPIDAISFVARLGKDSLRSSSPSLETPRVSEVSLRANRYTFDYAML